MTLKEIKDAFSGKNPAVKADDYEGQERRQRQVMASWLLPRVLVALTTVSTLLLALFIYVAKKVWNTTDETHDAVIEMKTNAQNVQDRVHQLELDRAQIEGDLGGHEKRLIRLETGKMPDNGR